MIHSIKIRNFNGFKEETLMDFTVNNRVKPSSKYAETDAGERVSKVNVIVGPNASGKTTILRALTDIKWLLASSVRDTRRVDNLFDPHANQKTEPSYLGVDFGIGADLYTYSVEVEGVRIKSESMTVRKMNQVRQSNKIVFSREWNSKSKKYSFGEYAMTVKLPLNELDRIMLEDTSINAIAAFFGDKEAQKIAKYWKDMTTNVELGRHSFIVYGMQAQAVFERVSRNKESASDFFDSIKAYNRNMTSYNPKTGMVTFGQGEKSYLLDVTQLSSGTTQLVVIKDKLEKALKTGSVALIDEFDAYLHPTWLADLVSQFMDPAINKKNAQLITTTHNPQVLNMLDQYQIFVADTVDDNAEVSRLDEIKGVRADDNFFANYMSGRYGGIPEVG
jgi:AAA15 family ATPase/GTPase